MGEFFGQVFFEAHFLVVIFSISRANHPRVISLTPNNVFYGHQLELYDWFLNIENTENTLTVFIIKLTVFHDKNLLTLNISAPI